MMDKSDKEFPMSRTIGDLQRVHHAVYLQARKIQLSDNHENVVRHVLIAEKFRK